MLFALPQQYSFEQPLSVLAAAKWGQNKSSAKSYAKVEQSENSCGSRQPSRESQRPETLRQMLFAIPGVDACQIDVLPAQRRDVPEQMMGDLATHVA